MSDTSQKNKPQSVWDSIYDQTVKPIGQWWDKTQADPEAQPSQNPNKKVQARLKGVADVFRDSEN